MISASDVVEIATTARKNAGALHQRRREVRDLYGGEIAVPLSELYENERAATANLLIQGVDGTAQRIASTAPHIQWHPLRPGFKQHEDKARQQRQVSLGWHEANAMDLIRYRRARHITAYAESPVQMRWDRKRMIPSWGVRDPLDTFCAPPSRLDDMVPAWTVTCYTRSFDWVRKMYPEAWLTLAPKDWSPGSPAVVEIVEYHDGDEAVLVATGHRPMIDGYQSNPYGGQKAVLLERVENPAHRPTTVVPGRIGLTDERRGQYDGMIPKYIKEARLDALELRAIEDGIFPQQWLVARANEIPKIIQVANPREGKVGIVQGGSLETVNKNPGYKTREARADLERAQRIEGNVTASMTGEAISGARTARMAESVEGGSIDFGIREIQKILARSEQAELEIAADLAKAYAGNVMVSMYVSGKGSKGPVSYKADDLFDERCAVTVEYAMAGTDLNQQVVRVGQKLQLELISTQTAREQDPEVQDAELEKDRRTAEGLEKAVMSGLQQLALTAAENPGVLDQVLRISELVITNKKELIEASIQAANEAKQAQAAVAPPAGMAAAPESMPGLGAPSAPQAGPPDLSSVAARLQAAMGGQAA